MKLYVSDADECPYGVNFHTHGVKENFGHLDFEVVFPMEFEMCHYIFFKIIEIIVAGQKFEANHTYPDVLGNNYNLKFIESQEGDRPVLRLIFPGKDGNLDEDNIHITFKKQYNIGGNNVT